RRTPRGRQSDRAGARGRVAHPRAPSVCPVNPEYIVGFCPADRGGPRPYRDHESRRWCRANEVRPWGERGTTATDTVRRGAGYGPPSHSCPRRRVTTRRGGAAVCGGVG